MTYAQELGRKAIHLASSVIPITYWFLAKDLMLSLLIPLTIIAILIDYSRQKSKWLHDFIHKYFGGIIRDREDQTLTGASYVFISEVVAIALFPKPIAIAGLLLLSVGDSAAALIGRGIGTHQIYRSKTWEGTLGFIILGTIAASFVPGVPFFAALLAAIAGAIVELYLNTIDDNIFIPVAGGLVLLLLLNL